MTTHHHPADVARMSDERFDRLQRKHDRQEWLDGDDLDLLLTEARCARAEARSLQSQVDEACRRWGLDKDALTALRAELELLRRVVEACHRWRRGESGYLSELHAALDALPQPAQRTPQTPACHIVSVASNVCSRGTKSCVLSHEDDAKPPPLAPVARGQRLREMAERCGELTETLLAVPNNAEGAAIAKAMAGGVAAADDPPPFVLPRAWWTLDAESRRALNMPETFTVTSAALPVYDWNSALAAIEAELTEQRRENARRKSEHAELANAVEELAVQVRELAARVGGER